MDDPAAVAVEILSGLERRGFPCALGGALALNWWSEPRGTLDADINVFVEETRFDELVDAFVAAGVELDREQWLARFRSGDVAIGRLAGVRVDVFVPSIPFYDVAARHVQRVRIYGVEIPILSAEVLAVFKLLFFRPKDLVDLDTLVRRRAGRLDVAWVRAHIAEIMGDDDERVRAWDALAGD